MWLLSLMVLVFEKDLGTSLLYFGMFVVTLYIATERVSWMIIGLALFLGGAFGAYALGVGHQFPRAGRGLAASVRRSEPQPAIRWFSRCLGFGTGGLFGAGPGAGHPTLVPEVRNDFIFAGIGEEIGLFGLTALLVIYLIIVERGSAYRDRRPGLVRQAAGRRSRVHARRCRSS